MKTYRTAIIGCGRIGSEFDQKPKGNIAFSHAGAYFLHPKTDLVAACDCDPKKLKTFKKKWKTNSVYLDFKKMLRKEKIEILSICTPTETHWPIVRDASEFPPKAIYCEKPITSNLKDAKNMVELCKEKKILLIINHQRRFEPFYQELKEKISNNFFGEIQQVNCYYTRGIFNTGSHILDLFLFLFGKFDRLIAYYSKNKSPFKKDPNLDGMIWFKNGPVVTIKACDDSYYLILEIDILGSKGRLRLGSRLEYFKTKKTQNLLKMKQLVGCKKSPFKAIYGPVSLVHGVNHIINCLEKKEKPLSSGQHAIVSVQTIKTMLSSAKSSKK